MENEMRSPFRYRIEAVVDWRRQRRESNSSDRQLQSEEEFFPFWSKDNRLLDSFPKRFDEVGEHLPSRSDTRDLERLPV
jgi:hypothetical protein